MRTTRLCYEARQVHRNSHEEDQPRSGMGLRHKVVAISNQRLQNVVDSAPKGLLNHIAIFRHIFARRSEILLFLTFLSSDTSRHLLNPSLLSLTNGGLLHELFLSVRFFVERGICEQSPQLVENKQRTEVTTP